MSPKATFGRNKIGSVAFTGMAGYYVVRVASSLGVESRACGHSSGISKNVNPLQQPAIDDCAITTRKNGRSDTDGHVMPCRCHAGAWRWRVAARAAREPKIGEICIHDRIDA